MNHDEHECGERSCEGSRDLPYRYDWQIARVTTDPTGDYFAATTLDGAEILTYRGPHHTHVAIYNPDGAILAHYHGPAAERFFDALRADTSPGPRL